VAAILKMATSRNFSMSGINSGHHYLPTYQIVMISDNVEFLRIVAAMLQMAISRLFSMSGINSEHHYLSTYQIVMISNNVEFLPPIFYTVFWEGLKGVGVTIESYGKVEISYINVDNF
jgi:5-carboxymethyl-2-hydroxymuconate isomerase